MDTFDTPSHPIPPHPIKLALRASGVNPALDPGGRCKDLVKTSKGLWSENIKILLKLEKNVQKRRVTGGVLKQLTFSMIFRKYISP